MSLQSLSLATGIPTGVVPKPPMAARQPSAPKQTHRGGRSGRGASKNDVVTHHANMGAAIQSGDHAAAISHGFKAIRALSAFKAQSDAGPSSDPGDSDDDDTPAAIAAPTPGKPGTTAATPTGPHGSGLAPGASSGGMNRIATLLRSASKK